MAYQIAGGFRISPRMLQAAGLFLGLSLCAPDHGRGQTIAAPPSPEATPVMLPFRPSQELLDRVRAQQEAAAVQTPAPTPTPYPVAATPMPASTPAPPSQSTAMRPAPSGQINVQSAGQLPEPTQMHGTVIVGNRLYVLGGNTESGWTEVVVSAPIDADGNLGQWRPERELPELRAYIGSGVVARGNRIYVVAGLVPIDPLQPENAAPAAKDVAWTTVNPDGSLDTWRISEAFPAHTGLYNHAAAVTDKHLYVIGGFYGISCVADVFVSDFDNDGAPVNWRRTSPLPSTLWFHGAAAHNGTLYAWGGLTERSSSAINSSIYTAKIAADGSLDPWEVETPMPDGTYGAAYGIAGGRLLSIAGRYHGGVPTPDLWGSALTSAGAAPWQVFGTNLETRIYHAAAFHEPTGWAYVVGGKWRGPADESRAIIGIIQSFRAATP